MQPGKRASLGLEGKNVFRVNLLGALLSPSAKPDLLYAVTMHRPNEKIRNILQLSAAILSQSRVIFLGKVLLLLRLLDPKKTEIAYHDTDSVIIVTNGEPIEDLAKKDLNCEQRHLLVELFEDPDAAIHQTGLFKVLFFEKIKKIKK